MLDKYIVTAKLKNNKHVVLDAPNYSDMNIGYRYMTDREVVGMGMDISNSGIQLYAPIYKTLEDGQIVLFTIIEATPIVLNRMDMKL